ncbi:MAG: hypothetical protein ACFFDH_01145 [Promethearchaeota archaeon]
MLFTPFSNFLLQAGDGVKVENPSTPKASQSASWFINPSVSNKFISPEKSPGFSDTTLYSFAITESKNFTLKISCYYDPIENYPGIFLAGENIPSNAYLMQNGTWLIVIQDIDYTATKQDLWLGIGTNKTNFQWQKIGIVNFTTSDSIAVAADESGEIIVVYREEYGVYESFDGLKYFSSDDWGTTWNNGTLMNFTEWDKEGWGFHGLSMSAFDGNFTAAWSISNVTGGSYKNATIWTSVHDPIHKWSPPRNLNALKDMACLAPQVFYNRTNGNGSLYIAYNYYPNISVNTMEFNISQFDNGFDGNHIRSWNITFSKSEMGGYCIGTPLVRCTMDYSMELFYFIDQTESEGEQGIRNATWGDPDVYENQVDYFQTQAGYGAFNLYANNGAKCFSGEVQFENGLLGPGILDAENPFNLLFFNQSIEEYETYSYFFDGKDSQGKTHNAQAYSFNLIVGEHSNELENNLIVYVDDVPAEFEYNVSNNQISPFTSLGIQDQFSINVSSEKPGNVRFNLKSGYPINNTYEITSGNYPVSFPMICGDGLTNYLFYTEKVNDIFNLMITKSIDGGLSWEEPRTIKGNIEHNWGRLRATVKGDNIYLWTRTEQSSDGSLFISSDAGESFIQTKLSRPVQGITSDLKCWFGDATDSNTFEINVSNDLGFTFESFINVTIPDHSVNYSLQGAAHDPITGNYSFLIAHIEDPEIHTIITNNNGSQVTISGNQLVDGVQPLVMGNGYKLTTDLHARKLENNTYQWVLTTIAKNPPFIENFTSILAYKVSTGGTTFGNWQNFTEITGDVLYAFAIFMGWNLFFPEKGLPCFVTGVRKGSTLQTFQLETSSSSNVVFSISKPLDKNYQGSVKFSGISGTGEILEDDLYTWDLITTDRAGYESTVSGDLLIDNTIPAFQTNKDVITSYKPLPIKNVTITIPIYEINPAKGYLHYRIPGDDWQILNMTLDSSMFPYLNYTAIIPAQADNVTIVYWKAEIYDMCGNLFEVDNNGLLYSYDKGIFEYVKESGNLSPTLYDDWTWTYVFTSGTSHIKSVWLSRTFDGTLQPNIPINAMDALNTTYSILITHDLVHLNANYRLMFQSDEGENFTIEEISLSRPAIILEEEQEPPSVLDLDIESSFEVSILVSQYNQYINYIYIEYEFDDGNGVIFDNLTGSGNLYKFEFTSFSSDVTQLTYEIFAVDIYGNIISLGQTRTISLIPALPSWEMSITEQFILVLVSLILGIVSGIVYSTLLKRKTYQKKLWESLSKVITEESEREKAVKDANLTMVSIREQKVVDTIAFKKYSLILKLNLLLIGVLFTMGLVSLLILNLTTLSMLLFISEFLCSIVLWGFSSNYLVEKLILNKEDASVFDVKIWLVLSAILILVGILSIFFVGNTFAWWRVRVNEQSYNIGVFKVPRALFTVLTAFFTSIIVLTFSTYKSAKKVKKDLITGENFNENPLTLLERKETEISTLSGKVGRKGLLFLTIITFTIIFASDLSVYAAQGILLLLPFLIGILSVIGFFLAFYRKKYKIETDVVLDNLINCPHCQTPTPLGGNYCEQCGESLLLGKRYETGKLCPRCNKTNSESSKHCRFCSAELSD